MSTTEMLVQLKEILGYPLFTVSNVNINTATIQLDVHLDAPVEKALTAIGRT